MDRGKNANSLICYFHRDQVLCAGYMGQSLQNGCHIVPATESCLCVTSAWNSAWHVLLTTVNFHVCSCCG
jgi:hypothetical protein